MHYRLSAEEMELLATHRAKLDAKLEIVSEKKAELEEESASPEVACNQSRLLELHKQMVEIDGRLEELYEAWEVLAADADEKNI